MRLLISVMLLSFSLSAFTQERIIVIGGSVAEIISELEFTNKVVGIDLTSKGVPGLSDKKILGMPQAINAESVLSLNPDLVLYGESNTNKKLIEQLKIGKIKVHEVKERNSLENIVEKIDSVASLLGVNDKALVLKEKIKKDIKILEQYKKPEGVKVAFVYARGPSQIFLAGKDTPAHTVIEQMGLKNAFDSLSGFKPISSESLILMNPDYLIMLESGVQSLTNVWEIPGLSKTNAGKNKRLIEVDTLPFLGFVGSTPKELIAILDKINNERK